MAITKPAHLLYPPVFRRNIYAMAGNWKIDSGVVALAKLGWFDPFSGHGTSPLYAKKNGVKYLGFDTNKLAFAEYLDAVNQACERLGGKTSLVKCADSTIFDPELVEKFDLCYTSPPYFNFEEYGGNTAHFEGCNSYSEFHDKITVPVFRNVIRYLIPSGILALQIEQNKTLMKNWEQVITSIGFKLISSGNTGEEAQKYSKMSKRSQGLLIFKKD